MNTIEQKRLQLVKNWLYYAKEDLKAVKSLVEDKLYAPACFHSQQVVEKALKAIILQKFDTTPKSHNIVQIAKATKEQKLLEDFGEDFEFIDKFYLPARYPDSIAGSLPEGLPDKQDAQKTLQIAETVYNQVILPC